MRFVHIAGTNGKGSAAEYISNIITASGQTCGIFTSPHLISETERMRIDGAEIDEDKLAALMNHVRENGLVVNKTLFAAYTAAALKWFSQQNVDFAVLETGIGGRLDPTNHITPSVCVLTSIDYDHTAVLGSRLAQIAAEKCGIVKPGVPVISAPQHADVMAVIKTHCNDKNAPLMVIDEVNVMSSSREGQAFRFDGAVYSISSIGEHQPINAALAVETAKQLGISAQNIHTGLKNASLAGRTQLIAGDPDMLIDGAHNPAAVKSLVKTLDKFFPDGRKVLLFACMADKDTQRMASALGGRFVSAVVTRVDTDRGAEPGSLQPLFSEYTSCIVQPEPDAAFAQVKQLSLDENALLVVCGSVYLAGHVLALLG